MVCFVASHGAVFCLCSCWPWARRSGLGIPSLLCASAFIHGCTSHIALPRAHSGFMLCRVLLDPTSYCSSPEQKPALPLVVLLVLKVLLPPVLWGTHMMSTGDHPSGAGCSQGILASSAVRGKSIWQWGEKQSWRQARAGQDLVSCPVQVAPAAALLPPDCSSLGCPVLAAPHCPADPCVEAVPSSPSFTLLNAFPYFSSLEQSPCHPPGPLWHRNGWGVAMG